MTKRDHFFEKIDHVDCSYSGSMKIVDKTYPWYFKMPFIMVMASVFLVLFFVGFIFDMAMLAMVSAIFFFVGCIFTTFLLFLRVPTYTLECPHCKTRLFHKSY